MWFKITTRWCNNAYKNFKDYDSYLILIYLMNQVFQKYSDRFHYLSMEEFYEKNEVGLIKLNLIEISKELNIPKETIRRKVNFLQSQNIIFRKGKAIYFNRKIGNSKTMSNSKKLWLIFYPKLQILIKRRLGLVEHFQKEEIENLLINILQYVGNIGLDCKFLT